MAIAPTGAIYKSLIFDGEDSRDYGVYITGQAVYNAPERDVEMINIPGRNGSFALDKGRFQNIEVTYPAGIFADNEADFAQGISDFRNFLCSRNGYVRLTDDYNPGEYRMAVYKSGLDVSPAQLKAGEFQIVFDCKPQRFLTSGEELITIGEWHETETASGEIASFEAVEGDGVKSLVVDIEPYQSGSGTPSPDNVRPISGYDSVVVSRCRKNLLPYPYYNTSKTHNGVTWTVNADGTITANGTATSESQFILTGSVNGDDYVGKIFSALTRSSGTPWKIRALIQLYGSPWTTIDADYGRGVTVPNTASGINIRFLLCVKSGETVTNEVFKPMIRLASETDATYEPYQGNTYTTDLSGTRYGGTLDVASGVLTVTKAIVDMTNYASRWTADIAHERAYVTVNEFKTPLAQPANIICNRFKTVDALKIYTMEEYGVGLSSGNALQFRISGVTDQPTATTATIAEYFANNPTQVVYELATPTTVQLTAQEVELLVGLNQIWANSGDVSIEYGTAPNVVVNPTLFESSPMLEVEGYGNIHFNGYEIALNDALIGEITLANRTIFAAKNKTISLDTTLLNNGDTITVSEIRLSLYVKMSSYTIEGDTSVSDSDSSFASFWTGAIRANPMQWKSINVYTVLSSFSFTKGNTATYTDTVTINLKDQNGTFTATCGITVTASANAISITRTVSTSPQHRYTLSTGNNNSYIGEIKGDSTQTYLGDPTIVDCDLGEAYRVDDGVVTSLNQYIDLGSDLPKLASGENEITYDNTVTDLKVIPRWWRI